MIRDKFERDRVGNDWPRVTQGTRYQDVQDDVEGESGWKDQMNELLEEWPRVTQGTRYQTDAAGEKV